ncbi:hypothetical protein PG994_002949 [Apiospora phragmitis]|uniref:Uncharacterized protein n=1 Tax=Apiospora phragmitis TaxID=2905665 RepID=A0ABR1W6M8_9PEZI
MAWKRTDVEGVYSRPLGENESFIKLVGDAGLQLPYKREHWAINSTATITPMGHMESQDLVALFRCAWAHLRFQHPSLAVDVNPPPNDTSLSYTVPADGPTLDTWVNRTFIVAADASSSADVIPTFQSTSYAKLVWIPRSGELLGHTSHWRTDGVGVPLLLDNFLALASGPPLAEPASLAWGTEIERLAPSVEDAAAMPTNSTPELKERGAAAVGTFAHVAGAIGIPCLGDAATLPAGTRSVSLTLDKEESKRVMAACKQLGVSVKTAMHAGVAGANNALADEAERGSKHYTSTVRFSLRPYLPAPYSAPAFAAGLYWTGWMKRVEPHMSWAERLQSYANEYRKGITPDTQLLGTPKAGFEVKAVGVGVEILSRQGTTFVWTFREQLNLSVNYYESFHSDEQMEEFVRTVRL